MSKELMYKVFVIWIGTASLMIGPFFMNFIIGKVLSVIGLSLLTIQTQRTKSYNLSLLNVVAICGYIYSIFTQ